MSRAHSDVADLYSKQERNRRSGSNNQKVQTLKSLGKQECAEDTEDKRNTEKSRLWIENGKLCLIPMKKVPKNKKVH